MANLSSKTGTITTPVQTQISLSNNATTSVQDMSAYDSQEVTGFVYVDATADLRCSFKVTVVKNGAGTYEIAAVDQAGDNYASAPLLVFSMSSSTLRVTLPNVTGFASAYMRYQLSAPYLGGNYPLSVDASQIVSGTVASARLPAGQLPGQATNTTIGAGYIGERISANSAGVNVASSSSFANIASITLTPGVWAVSGTYQLGISTIAGWSTTLVQISTSSGAADSNNNGGFVLFVPGSTTSAAGSPVIGSLGNRFISVASGTTTPVYLVGRIDYSSQSGCTWTLNSRIDAVRIA